MLKKIITLTGILTLSLWCLSGLPPAIAAVSPGVFVFSPEGEAETFNNWAGEGYILFDFLIDKNNNGNIDAEVWYTFDGSDRLEMAQMVQIDNNDNEIINSVKYYFYDPAGRIERIETDSDNNGGIDEVLSYYYNQDDTIDYQEFDKDNDGTPDEKITFVYENGRLVQKLRDENYDEVINSVTVYTYFPATDFLRRKEVGEYIPEEQKLGTGYYMEEYDYDEKEGNIFEIIVNNDYNERYDYKRTFYYDDNGWLHYEATDYDMDGYYNEIIHYVWIARDGDNNNAAGDAKPSASCFVNSSRF